ncbi:hypothetical protein ACOME3_001124 [Neoechinorhynchus agilis]
MGSKRPRKSAEVKEDLSHDGKRQKMTTTKPSAKQILEPHSKSNAPEVIIIAEESMESKANKDESFQINAELPKSQPQILIINVKETNISTDLDRTTFKSDLKIGSKRARESTELKQDSIHDGKRLKVASKLTKPSRKRIPTPHPKLNAPEANIVQEFGIKAINTIQGALGEKGPLVNKEEQIWNYE